ncbi:MAG: tRNA pseudouridine synthase 2 [Marteilia pararefringens]
MNLGCFAPNVQPQSQHRIVKHLESCLSGIFAVYKPRDFHRHELIERLKSSIARDVTALIRRPICSIEYDGNKASEMTLRLKQDLSEVFSSSISSENNSTFQQLQESSEEDHISEKSDANDPHCNPILEMSHLNHFRVRKSDVVLEILDCPVFHHSGIVIVGLYQGCEILRQIKSSKWLSEYEIKSSLGRATRTFCSRHHKLNIPITDHDPMHFVTHEQLLRAVSVIDAKCRHEFMQQITMNTTAEQAYSILSQGLPRITGFEHHCKTNIIPQQKIYNVHLSEFIHPTFNIIVHGIDLETKYLDTISPLVINRIAKDKALVSNDAIRKTRFGPIDHTMCLALPEWSLANIIDNQIKTMISIKEEHLRFNAHIKCLTDSRKIEERSIDCKQIEDLR